jgi:hypothetical protein
MSFTQNPKYLQFANNVLDQNTFMRKFPIASLLLLGQRVKLRFLGRDLAIGMHVAQALVPCIGLAKNVFGEDAPAFLEQFKIMLTSCTV